MKKEKSDVLKRILIGIILGLLLCGLIYLFLAMFFKPSASTAVGGQKYVAPVEDEEIAKTTEEETEEQGEEKSTSSNKASNETTITVLKTDGEEVVVSNPNTANSTYFTMMQDGIRYFKIVYPEGSTDAIDAVQSLNKQIESMTGYQLPSSSDASNTSTYEILIGDTNRAESREVLSQLPNGGYAVAVNNNKIVIVGSNNYCWEKAINYFVEQVQATDGSAKVKKAIGCKFKFDTALQNALMSSEKLSATTSLVFEASSPSVNGVAMNVAQGGYTDGTYFYQAYIDYKKDDETKNNCCIVKYDMEGNPVQTSEIASLYHANDVTYNSKLGYFVVCHNAPKPTTISYVDPVDLSVVKTFDIEQKIYSIAYNEKTDRYAVGCSGGQTFRILDSNFKAVGEIYQPTSQTAGYVTQGNTCDDQFIYFVLYTQNVITVYDWDGNFITLIDLDISESEEPENISVVGEDIYIGVKAGKITKLYKVETLN